jgi:septum formation protein
MAAPTATFHVNCILPGDIGVLRSSVVMAFGTACASGSNPAMRKHPEPLRKSYHCAVRLILASASPRRAELLRSAGYDFEIRAVDIDERSKPGEPPAEYVERLAREKALRALGELSQKGPAKAGPHVPSISDVASGFPPPPKATARLAEAPFGREGGSRTESVIVLGADTAVVVGEAILGKPHDAEDAARMLRRLSGRSHQVMTGVCLQTTQRSVSHVEISSVTFAPLTEDQIAWYVASGEGADKAGGYAIQGLASRFIPRMEGSYSNVVGLPIAVVSDLLSRLTSLRSVLASGE